MHVCIPLQWLCLIKEGAHGGGEGGVVVGQGDGDWGGELRGDGITAVHHCGRDDDTVHLKLRISRTVITQITIPGTERSKNTCIYIMANDLTYDYNNYKYVSTFLVFSPDTLLSVVLEKN